MTDYLIKTNKTLNFKEWLLEGRGKAPPRYTYEETQEYVNWFKRLKKSKKVEIAAYVEKFSQIGKGSKKELDLTRYEDYVEGEELWEIRVGTNYRVYFNFTSTRSFVVIWGGTKSTQAIDIQIARGINYE